MMGHNGSSRDLENETKEAYSGVLDTTRFEILDVLGKGTWGTVYKAKDRVTGNFAALKVLTPTDLAREQMVQRGQTPQSVLLNESGEMHACARIVPRTLEIDGNGTYFLRMPVMKMFLDDVLNEDESGKSRVRVGHGLGYETVKGYARDLFEGLREMHQIRGDVHADIKPANIALDENGRLYLNDLGTSTCASLQPVNANGNRGERGFELTRAPECFLGKDPSRKSDVWGAAALVYRMMDFEGKYPLEDEFGNVKDKRAYLEQLGNERLRALIRQKVRNNISRECKGVGKILEKCLDPDPRQRPDSGEITSLIDYATGKNKLLKDVWKFTKRFGVAVGAATALGYAIFATVNAPKPIEKDVPKVSGLLHLSEYSTDGTRTVYDIEELSGLPKTVHGMMIGAPANYSKNATTDMAVAFLVDAHRNALDAARSEDVVTDYQREIFWENATDEDRKSPILIGDRKTGWDVFRMPARALEDTLRLLKNSNGKIDNLEILDPRVQRYKSIETFDGHVDLEDLMTISRYGPKKVQLAQNLSGSPFFRDYIESKLFSNSERDFMKMWMAYVHEGLARR